MSCRTCLASRWPGHRHSGYAARMRRRVRLHCGYWLALGSCERRPTDGTDVPISSTDRVARPSGRSENESNEHGLVRKWSTYESTVSWSDGEAHEEWICPT